MVVTDVIADMLTRIRNAIGAKHTSVDIPASKMKESIAKILVEEGYVAEYSLVTEPYDTIRVVLKYDDRGASIISGLRRISKPGLRIYANADKLPKVLNGLGIAIISTSAGIMTDKQARIKNTGGEVLAYVW